ncbi:MAG: mercuric reductase [Acidobacteria bacterium]|nr:mercuric reductase [Acidobacteriota bacterium]
MTESARAKDLAKDLEGLDPELREVLEPFDDHNQRLIDNVHPLAWSNPKPADRYHLLVVGGGTAGLVSAAGAAGLGARVALVEKRLLGGDCLNYGCVPSKALIRAARAWHAAQGPNPFGAPTTVEGTGDFGAVMERMRKLRADISRHDSAERFRALGIDVFIGEGRFVASDALDVDGQRLHFRKAVVATGASPMILPIPGLSESEYLTNETVFSLTALPPRLAIIGGGPIGCELAQSFARFGSRVSIFDIAPHILVREDADAAEIVQQALTRDGVDLQLRTNIQKIASRGGETVIFFERDGSSQELRCDRLLLAVGRVANVHGIGLEAAGVEFSKHGVEVDDRLRTSNRRIYAVGDVATRFKFTHMADALARIAIQNSLFFGRKRASDLVVPWCTYTDPEIAHVGMYAEDAEKAGIKIETVTVPLSEVDRSVLEGSDQGFLRLHIQKGKDRVLGATLVADHAGDMLGELSLAVTHKIGLGKIAATIHAYPTQAEVIKKAADSWRRGKLTPTVSKVFEIFFKIFR